MHLPHDSIMLMMTCLGLFVVGMSIASNFDYPGVVVTEAVAGAIPIERLGFKTAKFVGTALRGPVNKPVLITSERQFRDIFGPRVSTSYLHDAIRQWFENVNAPCYVVRVVNTGAVVSTTTLIKEGTPQVITVTVTGTVGVAGAGNAKVIVTAAGMVGSPITVTFAVANNDSATIVAGKARAALALNATIDSFFTIGGTNAIITLTRKATAANDTTMAASVNNDTSSGLTLANSSITTPGVADLDVLQIDSYGPGADYNYAASPTHGISVNYTGGLLYIFDGGALKEPYRDVVFGNAAKSAQLINGHSNLIQITWLDTTVNPSDATAQGLADGANGSSVTATQVIGSESVAPKTGIYAFATKDLPLGYHLAPGYTTNAVGNALIDVAERYRGLALIDATFGLSVQQAITEKQQYASSHGYAIYVYGWVQMTDPDTGALVWVPRSPIRAAHIARSHTQPGGLANVGAGVDYRLRNVPYDPQNGAYGLETDNPYLMDDLTQGELNRNGIDVARNFAREGYGIVHWAARTISPEVLFRFLHVRILLNVIAESIEIGLKPYVFRVVDGRGVLASEIKATIDGLLWDLWNNDSLFGGTPGDAFFVKLQSSFVELEQGIINVEVYVKPVPIAERINVTLFRVPLGFDFKTGEVKIGDAELRAAA